MTRSELVEQIKARKSFLCVGLDTDMSKIPAILNGGDDPAFEFNKKIIDATQDFCVAYKLNTAFYEANASAGWESLKKTIEYIPASHFVIADAKRGDIGNTSTMYANAFFENLQADAVTVAPYMGEDSVRPFLQFNGKWTILLALTSNEGSRDFQYVEINDDLPLYKKVILKSQDWGTTENLMYVVGATRIEQLTEIRQIAPEHFLLIPGVGAQGGSLKEVAEKTLIKDYGILINSSREIIYASSGEDFAEKAAEKAQALQQEMLRYF